MITTGRVDNRDKTEYKAAQYIADKPDYIKDYYRRGLLMGGGSHTTHYVYICMACRYIAYLQSKGIDVSTTENFDYRNTSDYLASVSMGDDGARRSNSYFNTTWSSLNRFFKFLIADGQMTVNPLDRIGRAKGKDHPNRIVLDSKEIKTTFHRIKEEQEYKSGKYWWMPYRDEAIIMILLQTGIRATALTEINMDNVVVNYDSEGNPVGATINIIDKEETEFRRYISSDAVKSILVWERVRKHLLEEIGWSEVDALFLGANLDRMSLRGVERVVEKYTPEVNGHKVTPHKFRATYGTTLYKDTHDIHYVQKQMGHASPETTQIYIVDTGEDERKATDIMERLMKGE